MTKSRQKIEFGDFQTPTPLAQQVCDLLKRNGIEPSTILEPTCGRGSFVAAALDCFENASVILGYDINPEYVARTRRKVSRKKSGRTVAIKPANFFETDWRTLIGQQPEPILIIGNPPWVVNAALGSLGSSNLPAKTNFQAHTGFDAITGKSNFDISEWMLIRLLETLDSRRGVLAMLCKTAVARKLVSYAARTGLKLNRFRIIRFDAMEHFQVAVDACLFVCESGERANYDTEVFSSFDSITPEAVLGHRDGVIVADTTVYDRWRRLTDSTEYVWRSGIKHDCSKVMELFVQGDRFINGLGEEVDLETTYLYPMLKSSDLANGRHKKPQRYMLVTQQSLGEDTDVIRRRAPKTWKYLTDHAPLLERRASRIYKDRPRFSIFGVGNYSFAKWKVAISGLYKKIDFRVLEPQSGKPIVVDDTCYFLPARNRAEAVVLAAALNSTIASQFYKSLIFWDEKRPIKKEILQRLSPSKLIRELGSTYLHVHARECAPGLKAELIDQAIEAALQREPSSQPDMFVIA